MSIGDEVAIRAWNLLHNDVGGIDLAGLPLIAAWLGITDLDGLLTRFEAMKQYKKPEDGDGPGAADA